MIGCLFLSANAHAMATAEHSWGAFSSCDNGWDDGAKVLWHMASALPEEAQLYKMVTEAAESGIGANFHVDKGARLCCHGNQPNVVNWLVDVLQRSHSLSGKTATTYEDLCAWIYGELTPANKQAVLHRASLSAGRAATVAAQGPADFWAALSTQGKFSRDQIDVTIWAEFPEIQKRIDVYLASQ